jgi:peroxisomal 2,4-dienoyl-CoA reductase
VTEASVFALQAAVDSLTRSLALEWGTDYNIRCNGIAPGPISDTPGMDKLNPEEVGKTGEVVPLGRMGEKWDIAMAAIFLAAETGNSAIMRLLICLIYLRILLTVFYLLRPID